VAPSGITHITEGPIIAIFSLYNPQQETVKERSHTKCHPQFGFISEYGNPLELTHGKAIINILHQLHILYIKCRNFIKTNATEKRSSYGKTSHSTNHKIPHLY
jgi:hypothetical protein